MEGARTFLETSTIHGFSYIATSRKYARLFWIVIVSFGFTTAGYLIHKSFQSWAESPVKTTIETFPISKIRFPKVTVCPPKNSFTDLNYDLMMADNISLTDEMKDELYEFAWESIEEYLGLIKLYNFQERNQVYNWYFGFSKVSIPFGFTYPTHLIETSAISGAVFTNYFGEQFNSNLVLKKIHYKVRVFMPESIVENENVTLHMKLEKNSIKGVDCKTENYITRGFQDVTCANGSTFYNNITYPFSFLKEYYGYFASFELKRNINSQEFANVSMNLMPGFRFSWWYAGTGDNLTPQPKFRNDETNKQFVRKV